MTNQGTAIVGFEDLDHTYRRALHRGWVDAQNRAWWRQYDLATTEEQFAYEAGRLHLVNVVAAKIAVPVWRGTIKDSKPFQLALLEAARVLGSPMPAVRPRS